MTTKFKGRCDDCIVACHEGHNLILHSQVTKEVLLQNCCGGITLFKYCPICGVKVILSEQMQVFIKENKLFVGD